MATGWANAMRLPPMKIWSTVVSERTNGRANRFFFFDVDEDLSEAKRASYLVGKRGTYLVGKRASYLVGRKRRDLMANDDTIPY